MLQRATPLGKHASFLSQTRATAANRRAGRRRGLERFRTVGDSLAPTAGSQRAPSGPQVGPESLRGGGRRTTAHTRSRRTHAEPSSVLREAAGQIATPWRARSQVSVRRAHSRQGAVGVAVEGTALGASACRLRDAVGRGDSGADFSSSSRPPARCALCITSKPYIPRC